MTRHVRMPTSMPAKLAGKWVAWTPNGLSIVGSGDTPEKARKAAMANGPDPVIEWTPSMGVALEWVPPADERFLGPTRP